MLEERDWVRDIRRGFLDGLGAAGWAALVRDATRSPPDLLGMTEAVAMAFRVGSLEGSGRSPRLVVGASRGDVNALNGFDLSSVGEGRGDAACIERQRCVIASRPRYGLL